MYTYLYVYNFSKIYIKIIQFKITYELYYIKIINE